MNYTLGFKVKKMREFRGYSQEYMAKKLGVTQEQYSYIENRQKEIPNDTLLNIAKALEVSKSDLINFSPENVIHNHFSDSSSGYFNITNLILESHEHERNAYKELRTELRKEIQELKDRKI